MTGEHTISEAALESIAGEPKGVVWVSNSPTLRDYLTPEQRRTMTMTANILCYFHNHSLSPFDHVGGIMQEAMQKLHDERTGRAVDPKTWVIDGDKLERWILKMVLGELYSGRILAAIGQTLQDVCPPLHYLEILYRNAGFPDGLGLYFNPTGLPHPFGRDDVGLTIGALPTKDQLTVGAFQVLFFGVHCYLPIMYIPPSDPLLANTWYRPSALTFEGCQTRIELTWHGGARSGEAVIPKRSRASSAALPEQHLSAEFIPALQAVDRFDQLLLELNLTPHPGCLLKRQADTVREVYNDLGSLTVDDCNAKWDNRIHEFVYSQVVL